MNTRRMIASLGAVALLAATGAGFAEPHGGGGGGAHFGGGGHAGGSGGGGHFTASGHAGPQAHFAPNRGGFHGTAPGAYARATVRGPVYGRATGRAVRPGYGAAPGWRYRPHWGGGYWGGAYWPGAYYGWSYPLFLAALPALYATYWWDGVPYYYVNNVYYTWSTPDSGYVATDPPPVDGDAGADGDADYAAPEDSVPPPEDAPPPANVPPPAAAGTAPPVGAAPGAILPGEVFAYPRNGQSEQQQATDKYECHKWAQSQSGFDPTAQPSAANPPAHRSAYRRALSACLEGRGYSTR